MVHSPSMADELIPVRCPFCSSFLVEASPGATIRRKCRQCKQLRTVTAFADKRWHGQPPAE